MKHVRTTRQYLTLLLAFLIMLLLFFTAYQVFRQIDRRLTLSAVNSFNVKSSLVVSEVSKSLSSYVTLARATAGLFSASDDVDRQEFNTFITELELSKNYPGLSAISYLQRVPSDEIVKFQELQRLDLIDSEIEVLRNFTVKPLPITDEDAFIINYIEPLAGRESALGFNQATSAERLAGIQKSISSSEVTAVAPLQFVSNVPGVLLYRAIDEDRLIIVSIRVNDFFNQISLSSEIDDANYLINAIQSDGSDGLVYVTDEYVEEGELKQSYLIGVGDQDWRLETSSTYADHVAFYDFQRIAYFLTLFLIASLLSTLGYFLLTSRFKAIRSSVQVSASKQEQEQRLGRLIHAVTRSGDSKIFWSLLRLAAKETGASTAILLKDNSDVWRSVETYQGHKIDDKQVEDLITEISKSIKLGVLKYSSATISNNRKLSRKFNPEIVTSSVAVPGSSKAAIILLFDRQDVVELSNDIAQYLSFIPAWFNREFERLQLDHSKDEFVSLASHQLRTPLTAIKWQGELLMEAESTAEKQEALQEIESSSNRMVDLIDSLLSISRINLGTFDFKPESINLCTLTDTLITELRRSLNVKASQISVTCEIEHEIVLDKFAITQIISNLVSNAVKYSPNKTPIKIVLTASERLLNIIVVDQGIGISESNQKRLFGQFYRADNAKNSTIEGTGLGLYLVYKLLTLMKGKVKVKSVLGKGTTFTATVPVGVSKT